MAIYLLYVISPVILYAITESLYKNKEQRDKKLIFLCGLVMFLMVGLRNPNVGSTDTTVYIKNWSLMRAIPFSELFSSLKNIDLEPGYLVSVWFFSHIFEDGQWLLVISGLFFSISVCQFVKKNCDNVVLALIIFNCLGVFNFMVQGLRQAIAMCICLWALEECKKEHLVRFFILVGIACTFHASAVIFSMVYLFSKMKINFKSISLFSLGAILCMNLLPRLFEMMNTFMNDSYEIGKGSESGGVVAILIYIVIISFALLCGDKNRKYAPMFFYMALVGVICMIMRNSISTIVERIAIYFAFSQMVVLPNTISNILEEKPRLVITYIALVLCFGVTLYKVSYMSLIPYTFFWQI